MQPTDLNAVLRTVDPQIDPDAVAFELKPVVFKVPETRKASRDLFVAVRGLFSFRRESFAKEEKFVTTFFSSEVGYFVRDHSSLRHVFGIHYDFTPNDRAHPAFHGTLKSFADFAEMVRDAYRFDADLVDDVEGILERVRIPTSQMDVFSVFLQICADHLMHANSTEEERAAFHSLLKHSAFCAGAAWKVDRMMTAEASQCYRARHWYPTTA